MKTWRLAPGERAPIFQATDLQGQTIDLANMHGDTILLSFFRYASCPLCNLRVRELIQEHDRLAAIGVSVLAIFQSPAERILQYVGRQKPPFPIIPDPQIKLYQLYGLESSWKGFFRAWSIGLPKVIRAVIGNRFLPGTVEGDLNRIPADFLINAQGLLIDVHYGLDIGDHIPLSRVINRVDRSSTVQQEDVN